MYLHQASPLATSDLLSATIYLAFSTSNPTAAIHSWKARLQPGYEEVQRLFLQPLLMTISTNDN